jgi:uncharacterized membrane protein
MRDKPRSLGRRLLIAATVIAVFLVGALGLAVVVLSKPRPRGETGPQADALARSIEKAVDKDAWERTGAVAWTFAGRNHHLWDRARSFDRVRFGDAYVLCDLSKRTGIAFRNRVRVGGAAEQTLVARAYAAWINDSFWLNPLVKLFDDGVTRSVVRTDEDGQALLISYSSGGLTPGDAYLWLLPATGEARPRGWRMWVSVLPIKGLGSSWDGWTQLATGAWVATRHQLGKTPIRLALTGVAGAATLRELVQGADPFAPLVGAAPADEISEALPPG